MELNAPLSFYIESYVVEHIIDDDWFWHSQTDTMAAGRAENSKFNGVRKPLTFWLYYYFMLYIIIIRRNEFVAVEFSVHVKSERA